MNVNKILPFLLLLPFLASCTSKYKIEGTSSVNSLDGKMLYLKSLRDGEWVKLDSAEVVHGRSVLNERENRFRTDGDTLYG